MGSRQNGFVTSGKRIGSEGWARGSQSRTRQLSANCSSCFCGESGSSRAGWVIHRPEPFANERTSATRRHCPSKEPTCPRWPNATHAPNGKPCSAAARPRSLPPSPMGNRRNNRVHVRPNGLSGRANEMGQGGGTLTPRLLPTVHRGNQDQVERRAGQPTKQDVSGRGL